MSTISERFYKDRVALNVLASNPDNAKDVFEAAEGHVLIGVLSKDYQTVAQAVKAMAGYGELIDDAVSIGLGGGDNKQAAIVEEIVKHYAGNHVNQVFPSVGATCANLDDEDRWVNALVSPTGHPGIVNISTGPFSSTSDEQAHIPIKAAIALVRDMGGRAIKFFPMKGLETETEFRAVATACAEEGFALEPTGGIDLTNFEQIVEIALEAGVKKIIPHVYSSIINSDTKDTNIDDVKQLLDMTKRLVDHYE